jgi:hypothetical protein
MSSPDDELAFIALCVLLGTFDILLLGAIMAWLNTKPS